MYARVPDSVVDNQDLVVNIDYQGEPKYKAMFYLSLATIVFIIIYLFIGHKLDFGRFVKFKKIEDWWSKE